MVLRAACYNFARIHESLRMTPAMAAGIASQLHDVGWIAGLIEAAYPEPWPEGHLSSTTAGLTAGLGGGFWSRKTPRVRRRECLTLLLQRFQISTVASGDILTFWCVQRV